MSARTTASRPIGVISDTHGILDRRALAAFSGVERILHAGDIGAAEVLWELRTVAPVTAVLGNMDAGRAFGEDLEGIVQTKLGGHRVTMVHRRHDVPGPILAESDIVVFGHSHRPLVQQVDGVLWVNPGSASQARGAPEGRSVALLELRSDGGASARIIRLSELGEGR